MRYLPIELDVRGRDALVVGAGAEVEAKVERLLAAGARVTLVAPGPVGPALAALAGEGRIALVARAATEADLDGKAVVFVAPDDEVLARRLHAAASATGRPLCTLDRPETSTFANAAVVTAGDLTLTFGTGGASPGAARRIREDLSALFADERFARFLARLRERREALPRGERAARMAEAVKGFAVEARLRFPAWFERGE